jgi:hypothetical protein
MNPSLIYYHNYSQGVEKKEQVVQASAGHTAANAEIITFKVLPAAVLKKAVCPAENLEFRVLAVDADRAEGIHGDHEIEPASIPDIFGACLAVINRVGPVPAPCAPCTPEVHA